VHAVTQRSHAAREETGGFPVAPSVPEGRDAAPGRGRPRCGRVELHDRFHHRRDMQSGEPLSRYMLEIVFCPGQSPLTLVLFFAIIASVCNNFWVTFSFRQYNQITLCFGTNSIITILYLLAVWSIGEHIITDYNYYASILPLMSRAVGMLSAGVSGEQLPCPGAASGAAFAGHLCLLHSRHR